MWFTGGICLCAFLYIINLNHSFIKKILVDGPLCWSLGASQRKPLKVGRLLAGLNVNPVLEIKGIHIHPNESFIVLNDTAQRGPTLSPMGLWKPNRPLCLSKSSRKRPVLHHQGKETCSSEIQKAGSLYSCCSSLACVAGANIMPERNLGEDRDILPYTFQPIIRRAKAGTQAETWRNATHWLAFSSLLSYFLKQ